MSDAEALPLFDSHAHLDLEPFDDDRLAMLQRARAVGVQAVVVPGITTASSAAIVQMAAASAGTLSASSSALIAPRLFAAVGVHPNSSGAFGEAAAAEQEVAALQQLAGAAEVVAIGEIGLDNYWDDVAPAVQQEAFRRQLALAAEAGKPVIIHSREANDEVAAVLRDWVAGSHFRNSPLARRPFAGVLHAFSGDAALAEEAYSWGFVLGLGGPVTFKGARALHAVVPQLRLDRLMLETDAPYLTPHPHRGSRNEPAYLTLVVQALAALYETPPNQVAAATTAVALRFFDLENRVRSDLSTPDLTS